MNNYFFKINGMLLPILILKIIACDVQAATSADVKITSYVREPICSIDVVSEFELSKSYIDKVGELEKRGKIDIKIECQESTNITTWLTAEADLGADPYSTTIKGTDESLHLYTTSFEGIDFNGVKEFCKGDVDRQCNLDIFTTGKNDTPGQGQAKVTFNLNVK